MRQTGKQSYRFAIAVGENVSLSRKDWLSTTPRFGRLPLSSVRWLLAVGAHWGDSRKRRQQAGSLMSGSKLPHSRAPAARKSRVLNGHSDYFQAREGF